MIEKARPPARVNKIRKTMQDISGWRFYAYYRNDYWKLETRISSGVRILDLYWYEKTNTLTISIIATPIAARGCGHATETLGIVGEIADALDLPVQLMAQPFTVNGEPVVTKKYLKAWYKKRGYSNRFSVYLYRKPNQKPKKISA